MAIPVHHFEDYMKLLISSDEVSPSEAGQHSIPPFLPLKTPAIDKALQQKQDVLQLSQKLIPDTNEESSDCELPYEQRMQRLEQRLAALLTADSPLLDSSDSERKISGFNGLRKSQNTTEETLFPAVTTTGLPGEVSSEIGSIEALSKTHCSNQDTHRQTTHTCNSVGVSNASSNDNVDQAHRASNSKVPVSRTNKGARSVKRAHSKELQTEQKPQLRTKSSQKQKVPSSQVKKQAKDEALKDELKESYSQLIFELESERERRWKAEQTTLRLVEQFKTIQSKHKEEQDIQKFTLAANLRLKKVIETDRDKIKVLEEAATKQNELLADKERELRKSNETLAEKVRRLKDLEKNALRLEKQEKQRRVQQAAQLKAARQETETAQQERLALQAQQDGVREELRQLQQTLAARESQHRRELALRPSPEDIQTLVQQRLAERESSGVTQQLHQRLSEAKQQYAELEDEFRAALHSEAHRYDQLQSESEAAFRERASLQRQVEQLTEKQEKSASMLQEMTRLVQEQKGRLSELERARSQYTRESRTREAQQEQQLDEARKRLVKHELLSKENTRLEAALRAQQSVAEGLRAERQLWSQELAQQGAALAQDRGRLDAKIETLAAECSALKKQLESETDALKIKAKVIEDQVETIGKLKQGLLERDAAVKSAREEALHVQRDLDARLVQEAAAYSELQDNYERLQRRKEELKEELGNLALELKQSKEKQRQMTETWKQKAESIGVVELQVSQMKCQWEAKERELTNERDKAVAAATEAVRKLKQVDDAFRSQVDSLTTNHETDLSDLRAQLEEARREGEARVEAVEAEMRQVLMEAEKSRLAQEARVRRATQALTELQAV